ncbi:hypothetical protein SAMN05444672_10785 [Bacillus sp. OK838]|nr:hypothetical protein SAMN05444672_10785 [Bacillus sp. OK838]
MPREDIWAEVFVQLDCPCLNVEQIILMKQPREELDHD